MITDTVCAERPVIRAISDFASAPFRRTRLSTSRSFCARIPAWFVPRCNGTGASSRKFSVSGRIPGHFLPLAVRTVWPKNKSE